MDTPLDSRDDMESTVIYNLSPELEAELMRRAREKGTNASAEAKEIIENHVIEETASETD